MTYYEGANGVLIIYIEMFNRAIAENYINMSNNESFFE